MSKTICNTIKVLACASMLFAISPLAAQDNYPSKPITIVAPYGPGGASDLASRILANILPKYIDESVIVENRAGASGVTGSTYVMGQDPDGYTLLLARIGSQAVAPARDPGIPYAWDDFTFLGLLELNPLVCMVNANSPYETFEDLSNAILEAPGTVTFSSAGVGTVDYMAGFMLLEVIGAAGDAAIHIPYGSGGEAVTAVVGGHTDYTCNNVGNAIGQIQGGNLRPLVVTTPERIPDLPEVPTAGELGIEAFEGVLGWSALYGPPGMSDERVEYWAEVLEKVSADEEWMRATQDLGSVPYIQSPEATGTFVENQFRMYRRLAEELGLMLE